MKLTMQVNRSNVAALLRAALAALIKGQATVTTEIGSPEFTVNGEPGIVLTKAGVESVKRKNFEAHARTAFLSEAVAEVAEKLQEATDLETIQRLAQELVEAKDSIEPDETGRRVLH